MNNRLNTCTFRLLLALLCAAASAQAAWLNKADNSDPLYLGSSWAGGTAPGAGDVGVWTNGAPSVSQSPSLGDNLGVAGIAFYNPGGASHTITATTGKTLTLGASGIDMASASQNLRIDCSVALGVDQVWAVGTATGRTLTMNGAVSGANSLTKSGNGLLVLAGTNTFGGAGKSITLNAGTLRLNNSAALGDAGTTFVVGGNASISTAIPGTELVNDNPIQLNADLSYVGNGNLSLGDGAVTLGTTPSVLVNAATEILAIGGAIDDGANSFGLTKTGPGILSLTGANTHGGTNTITAGALRVDADALSAAANLRLNGGTLESSGGMTFSRARGVDAGQVQWANGAGGGFSAFGGLLTVNIGGAAETLTWSNTPSFITSGALLFGNSTAADSTVLFMNPLDLNGATRTIDTQNGSADVDAEIAGNVTSASAAGLIKTGSGKLKLSGNANSFGGTVHVQAGTLAVTALNDSGDGIGSGPLKLGNTTTGAGLEYTNATDLVLNNRVIELAGTTGDATLSVSGTGTLTLNANMSATGANDKELVLDGNNTGDNTIGGNIPDNSTANLTGLIKQGPGTWVLGGTSGDGPLTVTAGLLKLGAADRISNSSTVTVNGASAILDLQGHSDGVATFVLTSGSITSAVGTVLTPLLNTPTVSSGTISPVIAGAAGIAKTTAGTVTLLGNNTFSGTVDIQDGKLATAYLGDSTTGNGTIRLGNVANSGALEYTGSANVTLSAARPVLLAGTTGDGILNSSGSGTLTVSTLATPINTSTQGKDLQLGGSNTGDNTLSATLVDEATGSRNLRLIKNDAGRWILTGNNTYSGAPNTTINGGVLQVGNGGTSGTLGGGAATLAAGGTLLFNRDGSYTFGGAITTVAGSSVTNAGPGTVTLNGAISGAGSVTEQGAGMLVLGTGNTHTGGNVIQSGTLRLGSNTALGAAASAKLNFAAGSNGKLQLFGFSPTVIELNGDSTATIENGAAGASVLTVNPAGATTSTLAALLQDGPSGTLALTKGGAGLLILSNTGNSYSGDTTVSAAGTLRLGASEVIPHGGGKGNLALTLANAILDMNDNDETVNGLSGAVAGVVTNSAGSATLTIGAADATGYSSSALFRDSGPGGATLHVIKTGTGTQTLAGVISMAGNLAVNGGTLVLGGANTYSGSTAVNAGTLKQGIATGIPNGAGKGDVAVAAAGALDMAGFATTINGLSGAGIVTNSGPAGADILTVGNNNADSTFDGSIRDGGAGLAYTQLTKAGTGRLTLNGTNDYVGLTTVGAGALRITANQGLGSPTTGNTLVSVGAALELAGGITVAESATINGTGPSGGGALRNVSGNNIWTGSISNGAAGTRVQADAGTTLTLAPAAGNAIYGTTLALVVGGEGHVTVNGPVGLTTGSLTKDGGGMLRLNSTDSFTTSKADVQAGALLVNGTMGGTHSVTVQSGATLGGGGVINRAVTNLAGSALAPGDPLVAGGIGTLTVKQLQLDAGSILRIEIASEATRDQIVVQNANGTSIGGAAASVPVYLYQPGGTNTFDADGVYDLIDFAGTLGGGVGPLYVANANLLKSYQFEESGGWVRLKISSVQAWDGGDADDNLWASGANWDGDSTPAPNAELHFDSGLRLSNTNNLGANLRFNGITFNAGAGAFTLAGDAIDLTGDIVNNSANAQTVALPLRLDGNSRQLDAGNGPLTISGDVGETGGSFGLNKTGPQRLTLAGNNTFGGAVAINTGALRATHGAALGTTNGATTVASGAALELDGGIVMAAEPISITGTGVANAGALRNIAGTNTLTGVVTLAGASRIHADAGTLTLDVPAGNAITGTGLPAVFGGDGNIAVADPIATGAAGTLTKEGAGRLTLGANNTYTGLTAIDAGTLRVMHATGLGTVAGGVTVSNGAALEIEGNITVALEPLTLAGGGVGGGGALRNTGGTNTYQGAITLGAGGARIHADSGALNIRGVTTAVGNDLTVGGAAEVLNGTGAIAGGGRLIKEGSGTFTIGVAATYTGHTVVTNGILRIGIVNAILNGPTAGNVYVYAGGTLDVAAGNDTVNGIWGDGKIDNTTGTPRTLTVGDNDQSSLFSGVLTNSGGTASLVLAKTGSGTLTLTGANGHGGGNTISAGTLQIGNGGTGGTLGSGATSIAAGSALVFNRAGTYPYAGAISGAGTATLSGPGTIVAGGVWSLTGGTTVNAGALQLGATDRFAAGTAITVNGGTFDINSVDESMGQITLLSGLIASTGDGGSLTGTNILAASGTIAARITDFASTPVTPLTKVGGGIVSLTRDDNLFAGKVSIVSGTLEIPSLAKLAVGSGLGAPTTAANGTIDLGSDTNAATLRVTGASGNSFSDRVLNLAGTTGRVTLDASGDGIVYLSTNLTATGAGAKTLELAGSQTGTNTLAGIVPDSAGGATAISKSGDGTWVLKGANTYSGGTTVDGGLLVIANTAGSGAGTGGVSVNTGATLGGSGSVAGTITLNGGALLRPGASVGTLTAGGLSLAPGSQLAMEFNATPTNDQVIVTGTDALTINGGGLYLYDEGTTTPWTTPGVYRLFRFAGSIQGAGVSSLSVLNPQAGHTYDFRIEGNWVVVRVTAGVPLLTLSDASVTEGNSGTTDLAFTLMLDPTGSVAVVANATTSDGTAKTAKGDYEARTGAVTIPAGIATTQIVVHVLGELKYESNETLTLTLSSVQNATVLRGTATGTINNDDAPDGHVYVDDTATGNGSGYNWDDAFADLQDGLRNAGPGQDIWVAQGTYRPTNGTARTAHFALRPANPVYGGFIGTETLFAQRHWMNATSILSGDIGSPGAAFDNCGPIVRTQLGAGSLLDGFTLRDGRNDGVQDSGFGGAMNVRPGFGITVQNCIFENNYANEGGAVHMQADSTFRRCIFRNNSDGARGGAIQCYFSNDVFENCLFTGNTGGGRGGVMSLYHQTISIVNCTFAGNSSQAGNALYVSNGAYVNALNCIFWDSGDHGGGIWVKSFTSNGDVGGFAAGMNVSFSDVRGGFAPPELGTSDNCIDSDPEFVLEGTDFHLAGTSPCKDTATSNGAPADDFEGGIRPFGAGFDMGAYEYGASGTGTPPTGLMIFVR